MRFRVLTSSVAALATLLLAAGLSAAIPTITPTGGAFRLTAADGVISTAEGNAIYFWGYSNDDRATSAPVEDDDPTPFPPIANTNGVQYPGPVLEVSEGDAVNVQLSSALPLGVQTSLVFPGQGPVTANLSGGPISLLGSREVGSGGTVTYSFTAGSPGTYMYQSGSDSDLQIEMGLFGMIIVRPSDYDSDPESAGHTAYGCSDSQYDREYMFIHSEMDARVHRIIQLQVTPQGDPPAPIAGYDRTAVDTTAFYPIYWFLNGRCAPDTFFRPNDPMVPTQPYGANVLAHPCERILIRLAGAGRDAHPFHHHGNHMEIIAKDANLLRSDASECADLSYETFTNMIQPGETIDGIFVWTGHNMGWDMYGHGPEDELAPCEDPADHGKPLPLLLPEGLDLTFGGFWSGSAFLGQEGALPPGEGGLDPSGGFCFPWHSHHGKELCNNDVFPGGATAVLIIEHPDQPIDEDYGVGASPPGAD